MANLLALAAADTFCVVYLSYGTNLHGANLFALFAPSTRMWIHMIPIYRNPIEQRIDGSQRTDVLAERTIDQYGQKNSADQNPQLPLEEKADDALQRRIRGNQWDSALQCACRTDPLTEPGKSGACCIHNKQWEQNNEHQQNNIFQPPQRPVQAKSPNFFQKRNFIKQFLYQSKWTQKATNKTSQHCPNQQEKSQQIEGYLIFCASQHRLQRTDRAGPKASRTGIAVQPGNAKILQPSVINFPLKKSDDIAIG